MSAIEINPQFKRALDLLQNEDLSLFITGKAGTGKSTLLEHFCAEAAKKPVILAPTGVAALNVKGQTIHSFFNFYIDVTPEKIRQKKVKPRNPKIYRLIKTIVIDEVSMVRADMLDCIDTFLRMYGPFSDRPFGGVQMVLVGDLYQLPPVVGMNEREIFESHYDSPYFFSARVFQEFQVQTVELEKVYRQKDEEFVSLLNRIRNNTVQEADLAHLNSRLNPHFRPVNDEFFISLTTTNSRADEINAEHLASLPGALQGFNAEVTGTFGPEYFPTAQKFQFKVGAQVMMLNNDAKKRWVNGSMGVVEAIKKVDGEENLSIRLQDDRLVLVPRFCWEVIRFSLVENEIKSQVAGTFTQFPVRLAWAVTIHKSQGKTFDRVILDIGRGTFAAGQVYVGLSRCTSFEGVVLKARIQKHHIQTDRQIVNFFSSARPAPTVGRPQAQGSLFA